MQWFGEPWPSRDLRAEVCKDDGQRVPTPVGQACMHCTEPIEASDSGVVMPCVRRAAAGDPGAVPYETSTLTTGDPRTEWYSTTVEPAHVECFIRSTFGSPAHLDGKCTCRDPHAAPSGMTYREEAREVWRRLRARA